MRCLKCGRETDQTFCEECRAEMHKHPVKPGTVVLIPKDRTADYSKRAQNYPPRKNVEAVIARQKKVIRRMALAIVTLIVLICSGTYIGYRLVHLNNGRPIGQNYSTHEKAAASTEPTAAEPEEETETPETTEADDDVSRETSEPKKQK